jgi:hypothetical protein
MAPADGCQASRSSPRTRRREVFVTSNDVVLDDPSRTWSIGSRESSSRLGLTARATSVSRIATLMATHSNTISRVGWMTTAIRPSSRSSGNRPLTATAPPHHPDSPAKGQL